jgi:hypothetical protein
MSKVIIIRGEGDAGKTTTAGYLYQDLLRQTPAPHQFDGQTATTDSLQYKSNGEIKDFVAIFNINGKIVVIISAGDVWGDLLAVIEGLPNFDVLICCARTRTSITFRELTKMYGSSIIHVENIHKQVDKSRIHKQKYVNNIIAKI